MDSAIPSVCPPIDFRFGSPDTPQLLGFRFPPISGVPQLDFDRTFAVVDSFGGDAGQCPQEEWTASIKTIAAEVARADYHRRRFIEILDLMVRRRKVVGGPVFGDPEPARAIYCESAAYLVSCRTLIDLVVFVAARRFGISEPGAESWKASKLVFAELLPPDQADVPEVLALRAQRDWFRKLNDYRNCTSHRGWHERSFGYFDPADTAQESNDPRHNVMLVPDWDSLQRGNRPHKWTYKSRTWLDALVVEIQAGLQELLRRLYELWSFPASREGRIPIAEQPNAFLTVPLVRPLQGQSPATMYVFTSKLAARAFFEQADQRGYEMERRLLSIRPTKFSSGSKYLLAWNWAFGTPHVHIVHYVDGTAKVIQKLVVRSEDIGGEETVLHLDLKGSVQGSVYILDVPRLADAEGSEPHA